jgi:hypothetical protein
VAAVGYVLFLDPDTVSRQDQAAVAGGWTGHLGPFYCEVQRPTFIFLRAADFAMKLLKGG